MKKFFITLAVVSLLLNVANAAPHKYRVRDSATAAALLARGGKVIADYGGFQMIEVDLPALTDAGKGAELEDESDVIELHAAHLNTRDTKVKAQRKTLGNFPGKRLHLVQFAGPVKPEWRDALEKTGVRIVTYIPNNAYLIYGDTASLAKLQSWAGAEATVQWEGDYADDYKINPHARLTNDLGQTQMPAIATFAIQLVDDAAANTNTLAIIDGLKQSSVQRQTRSLGYLDVIVELPTGQLGDLAAQPDVVSIQPYQTRHKLDERQDQIVAGNLIGNLPSGPGYLAWLASKGFTQAQFNASGFLVDVSDSGIDNGTTSPGHFGLYQSGIPAQGSRVVYNRLEGTANSGSTLSGCDGHGNLNTHIIAGYDNFTNFPHTDSTGYRYGLGVCPFVKVGSSVIFDPNNFTSPNYPNLQSRAYNNGARVSANSWGGSTAGAYDVDAQSYDALVRDAQPSGAAVPNTGNQQMVIVFAAGNDGPSVQTVGSPGTAKNVIVVGAAENVRSHSTANGGNNAAGNDGCTTPDTEADSANDMATFSSRGPCSDGRVKPDIIAPGTHITGGVGQSGSATTNGTGVALACFTGAGVCGLPGGGTAGNTNNFFPLGQQFYSTSSGTSHSTPAVAGGCALLRQYFINNSLTPPSPAMTKAFLMNSARYLTGDSANDTLPSDNQGMGEMNLGTAFDGAVRILHDQLTADKFTASGQVRIIAGLVADGSKPFRVTVAWTDAPGNTTGNAYNNDLDLTVTIGGQTYKGNVFSGANSVTGGSADKKNNVESVFIPAGVTGPFTVTVTAANINSDGVPNEAPATDQDYALVIYNGVETPTPVVNLTAFNLTAENCGTANGVIDPGETVTVNVALQNTGTANTTNLIVTLLATNGVTLPSAAKVYGALNTNGTVVTQAFSFTATGSCGGSLTATFALQDGTNALASINYPVTLGQLATVWSQNFDGVTKPALPAGWTTVAGGGLSAWKTTNSLSDTSPNSAFTACAATVGSNELDSAVIALPSGSSQLTFRHHYDLEASASSTTGYDGGVLEIKIGAGAYADILAAGGSFVSGGYTYTISSSYNSPFSGRQAWSGTNIGFTTVVVNLPAAAAGQNIQLRWRSGSDSSTAKTGWWVDSAAISSYVCCSGGYAPIITTNPASLTISAGNAATFSVAATGTAPLAYQWRFNNTNILGAITNFYNLASAQFTNAGNYAVVITNFSGSVTSTPAVLTVTTNVIAAVPVISAATYTNHQFSFIINGSVGSNYIIQASTNLAANNWITLATNVAPFLFIESNMNLFLQRFYRSGIAP